MVCHCEILCIILQLHFSRFLKHVFLIRHLLVRSNYVHKRDTITLRAHFYVTFLWYVCITSWNNLQLRFVFVCYWDVILLLILFYFIILLICSNGFVFWWRQNYVELWKLLKRVNCVWKLHYKIVIFWLQFFLSSTIKLIFFTFYICWYFIYVKIMFLVVCLH